MHTRACPHNMQHAPSYPSKVAEAYEVLKDDEKRGAYDRGDDLQQQGSPGFHHPFQGGGGGGWTFTFTM